MIHEKLCELILLNQIIDFNTWYDKECFKSKYNLDKIISRKKELEDEFLATYVIDKNSKE